jgi:hypothetical protein
MLQNNEELRIRRATLGRMCYYGCTIVQAPTGRAATGGALAGVPPATGVSRAAQIRYLNAQYNAWMMSIFSSLISLTKMAYDF